MIADLIAVATRQIEHVNNGQCPDSVQGFGVRDPDCPACRTIEAVEAVSKDETWRKTWKDIGA